MRLSAAATAATPPRGHVERQGACVVLSGNQSYREGKRMKGILAWLIGIPIPIIIILYLIDVF